MKKLLFLSFVMIGCSGYKQESLVGTYVAPARSMPELVMAQLKNVSYSANDSLVLNADSTLTYTNCSIEANGNWKLRKDTLLVYLGSKRLIADELNNNPAYKQFLRPDSLPRKYVMSDDGKSMEWLVKDKKGVTVIFELQRK